MPTLLSIGDLSIHFGQRAAVSGVSLSIDEGEVLGLVGESGSGKSTIALALMGLLPPAARLAGSIQWNTKSNKAQRNAAMIFQEPMTALNPSMNIGNQVAEALAVCQPLLTRRQLRVKTIETLELVSIPNPESRYTDYPYQFSGGQRQRILIAMALVQQPRLLIADEPTTALDVTIQAQVLALLKQLQRERNLAMLFISHDLAVVGQMSDRITVMRYGQMLETAESRTLLTQPQHAYTKMLLGAVPTMHTDRTQPLPTA